jgi:uncharacterized C2H2 Zn-finger protein
MSERKERAEELEVEELRELLFSRIRFGYSKHRCPRCGARMLSVFHSGGEEVLQCPECWYGGDDPDGVLRIVSTLDSVITREFPFLEEDPELGLFAGVITIVEMIEHLKPNEEADRALAEKMKEEMAMAERLRGRGARR